MILLIIDMQVEFFAARSKEIISACRREIRRARNLGWAIITVSYDNCGGESPLLPRIESSLGGYEKRFKVRKKHDDGSPEVSHVCNSHALDFSLIRVCGVNLGFCVRQTVIGLHEYFTETNFEIVFDACGCELNKEMSLLSLLDGKNRIKTVNYNRVKKTIYSPDCFDTLVCSSFSAAKP
jgi:nicotinamidase-related amidase